MPQRPYRPCKHVGCPELTRNKSGYCDKHIAEYEQRQKESNRYYEKSRGGSTKQGYGSDWQKVRLAYLKQHPLCEICQEQGKTVPARLVHHKKEIKDGGARLDFDNLQALCQTCHEAIHGPDRWKRKCHDAD